MNERFLARGKCENTKKWCYGYYLDTPKYTYQSDERTYAISRCSGYLDGGQTKVSSETVSQCVGIKDRSGNWIFEGDICEFGLYRYLICWIINQHSWGVLNLETRIVSRIYDLEYLNPGKSFKIIGNALDNPELLKETAQNGG